MLAVNYSSVRENLKSYFDQITDENETVIVTRKDEKNIVMISLTEWNALQKLARNNEYLAKIDRATADLQAGRGITKTMEELEAMENG